MYVAFKISLEVFMAVGVKIIGCKDMHSTREEPRVLRIENEASRPFSNSVVKFYDVVFQKIVIGVLKV
jgi:hypothetical protein